MRTVLILLKPFDQVIDVAAVPALPAFQQGLISQHLFAAYFTYSCVISSHLPVIDALICGIDRVEETSDALVRLADLCIVEGLFVAAPFVVFKPLELFVFAGELQGLSELDIVLLQEVEFVSEIGNGFEIEVLIKVALADNFNALITMPRGRMRSIVKDVINAWEMAQLLLKLIAKLPFLLLPKQLCCEIESV